MSVRKVAIGFGILLVLAAGGALAYQLIRGTTFSGSEPATIESLTPEQVDVSGITVVHQGADFDQTRREVLLTGQITNKTDKTVTVNVRIRLLDSATKDELESYVVTVTDIQPRQSVTYNQQQDYPDDLKPDTIDIQADAIGVF